jgi:carboxymethylenebutenolidase
VGEKVSFASNGGTAEGYLALPAAANGGAVIVIQEWWGLVGHITDVADRYAAQGFVTLAPDLYHGVTTREPDEAGKLMMGLAMDQAAKDIAGAAAYLASRPEARSGRVGTVGFCMGGSLALWAGTLSPHIVATVGFYPPLPWERMGPQWANYAGKAAQIHCDAHQDSTTPGVVMAKEAIEAAGGQVMTFDYPGTEHAFFNNDRSEVYVAQAADLAWERTVEFFGTSLT